MVFPFEVHYFLFFSFLLSVVCQRDRKLTKPQLSADVHAAESHFGIVRRSDEGQLNNYDFYATSLVTSQHDSWL